MICLGRHTADQLVELVLTTCQRDAALGGDGT
jgi:hypothetical protein